MKILKYLKFWRLPKKIWVTVLIILISLPVYYFWPKPKQKEVLTANVQTGEVKSIISASGTLEGTDSADLRFRIGGKLNYIGVKTGDRVEKGKLIASLDTKDLQIDLQQAYNTFVAKDAAAKKAEDNVKDHSSDENFTQKETRTAAQVARDNAYDDIKAAQRALEDAYIYAPISGVITQADPNPGQIISVTDIITKIVDDSEYIFEAEVDEADIGRVKLAQTAKVTLNSYSDRTFDAMVSKIMPATTETDSGATVIIVKLSLGKPDINFLSGLNGQADIIIEKANNVLVIPAESLMDDDEVYIAKVNTFEKIKVSPGIRSDTQIEIKSGLTSGDSVVINPQDIKTSGKNWFERLTGR